MRIYSQVKLALLALGMSVCALHVTAQVTSTNKEPEQTATTKTAAVAGAATVKKAPTGKVEPNPGVAKPQVGKKMVQDATISLQTTITGNQEQPKVLYILPWQSPLTEQVDFEPLDHQQKAVFNHVERDELRRELEVAGESQ